MTREDAYAKHGDALDQVEQLLTGMRDDDATMVREILATEGGDELIVRLELYYSDMDRADRTPRLIMYLNLGMLIGLFRSRTAH